MWVRRLFTRPAAGEDQPGGGEQIIGRDPRRRRFDGPLGDLIRAVDQHCQRPWCDHRIDDIDHRTPYTDGGTTTAADGDSYCRSSHTTKHLPGFTIRRPQHRQHRCTPTDLDHPHRTHLHQPATTTTRTTDHTSPPPKPHPAHQSAERHLQRLIGTHTTTHTSTRTTGHLRQ
ncbi:MAG: hypothetical protein WKF83_12525 [Nocardioidaceae bacterium]